MATGDEYNQFKVIQISKKIDNSKIKKYFYHYEEDINSKLRSFVSLICKTKLKFTQELLQKVYDRIQLLFPDFSFMSFEGRKKSLEKYLKETDINEINTQINNFVDFFFDNLRTLKAPKSLNPLKASSKSLLSKKSIRMQNNFNNEESQIEIVQKDFIKFCKQESNFFESLLQVQSEGKPIQ